MTMLDRMRRHRNWLKWSLALVVLTFIIFYIPDFLDRNSGTAGATSRETVATVDGQRLQAGEFQQRYVQQMQQYQQQFGGSMNQRGEMGDMVMWSSSATRQFGGGLGDWLSPATVAGLVRDGTVLPPTKTSCAIPAEVIRDAGQFRMGTLTAFGPQEDWAYPPRPANPKAAWNVQWTARVRHKSTTSWMDMPGMGGMGMDDGGDPRGQQQQQRPKRGLGGILGGGFGF